MNKDRGGTKENETANSLIAGVVLVAIFGLGIMCGGAIALRKGGDFTESAVVLFMMMSFAVVGFVELFLVRQISRVLGAGSKQERIEPPAQQQPLFQPATVPANEVRPSHLRTLPESVPSVTENTTRTLEHSFGKLK